MYHPRHGPLLYQMSICFHNTHGTILIMRHWLSSPSYTTSVLHLVKPVLWPHWILLFCLILTTFSFRFPRLGGQHLLCAVSIFLKLHNSSFRFIPSSVSIPPENKDYYIAIIAFICSWSRIHSLSFIFLGEFLLSFLKESGNFTDTLYVRAICYMCISRCSMVGTIQRSQWEPVPLLHPVLISGNDLAVK